MLMDIEMPITIELGRTKLSIKEILTLGQGSIIELDKLSGDPVDVFINEKRFARGEVVVVDENFGVRITEIVSPTEKIRSLQ
jgi:flagellar motor switch protein FliN/FliY